MKEAEYGQHILKILSGPEKQKKALEGKLQGIIGHF
jgi:hypothetical protein